MSDGVVVEFPGITTLDTDPNRVLDAAKDADLEGVIVLGWDKSGEEYLAASIADGRDVVWLLERCKLRVLRHDD